MKCEKCGYLEEVPVSELETIKNLPPVTDEYRILCPFCLNYMYEDKTNKTSNNNQ